GLANLPLADRATIGNMSPEFGSTCAIFPIDAETLRYLKFSGRPAEQVDLVEAYAQEQGLWHDEHSEEPTFTDRVELDLGDVEPSLAGPKRPQDRVALSEAKTEFREVLPGYVAKAAEADRKPGVPPHGSKGDDEDSFSFPASDPPSYSNGPFEDAPRREEATVAERPRTSVPVGDFELDHGHVVIAAITSCTNTSNPSVMLGAGLLARNALARGLETKPWVKTSLAPGSKVVTQYLERAGLTLELEALGFHLVGYGCTTCIGNSGPLPAKISAAIDEHDLAVTAVLSGNRNFEGRINPDVKMNYLASPPLCVAYALAGTMDWDPLTEPFPGSDVMLADVWPDAREVARTVEEVVHTEMFRSSYAEVFDGDERWRSLEIPTGDRFAWSDSTYVRQPPYFEDLPVDPVPVRDIEGARVLAKLGDSVTTDHISPAGSIGEDSPAGRWLVEHGVRKRDFNSYGSRRGNHEVMVRGTFANIRLRNQLAPGTEGGVTVKDGEPMTIYDAAMAYASEGVPLVVLGGKEYGSGSSRDWAAKGTSLLGVRAVIAESFERIHRANLVGMGVVPLQVDSIDLTGAEELSITGLAEPLNRGELPQEVTVSADGRELSARVRIDTPKEAEYFRHGGILPFVLRQLLAMP
nr:aconitate hydratase AcnA [Solirubrobacterales bacterium]